MFYVNGAEWYLSIVPPFHPMLKRKDGSFTLGCCDNDNQVIYIVNNLNPQKLWDVLVHEVAHCCFYTYGYNLDECCHEELIASFIEKHGLEVVELAKEIYNGIGYV